MAWGWLHFLSKFSFIGPALKFKIKMVSPYLHMRVLKATTPSRPCRKMPKESMKSPLEHPRASGSVGEELEEADGSWPRASTLTPTPAIAQHLQDHECLEKATKYQSREVEMIDRTMIQLRYIMKALSYEPPVTVTEAQTYRVSYWTSMRRHPVVSYLISVSRLCCINISFSIK